MANPYEYIIGGQIPDEVQTKAMAAKLRGADDRAMLALLSGDKVLTNVGTAMNERTQNRAGGLAKARENIESRKLREAEQLGQGEYRKILAEQNAIAAAQLEQNRQFNRDYKISEQTRQQAKDAKDNMKDYVDVRDKTGISSMESTFDQIDNLLEPYIEGDRVTGDIPGFNAGERMIANTPGLNLFSGE